MRHNLYLNFRTVDLALILFQNHNITITQPLIGEHTCNIPSN